MAKQAGEDFQAALAKNGVQNPAIQTHADLGTMLLPIALGLRRRGDRAAGRGHGSRIANAPAEAPTTKTWRVISVVVSVLVVLLAVGTTVQTVRAGHSGSAAVWSGVGS